MVRHSSPATTKSRPQRLYVYKLTTDDGGAPCVGGHDLLSLAICKPRVRSTAHEGDLIFGFAAKRLDPDNRLIYIARVTEVVVDGEYYESGAYRGRGDRIYVRRKDGRFHIRKNARFHKTGDQLTHDLGSDYEYKRTNVLLSNDFRYFGGSSMVYLDRYPEIRKMLARLTHGHRVNHAAALEQELRSLKQSVWRKFRKKVVGSPSQRPDPAGAHCGSCDPEGPSSLARLPLS